MFFQHTVHISRTRMWKKIVRVLYYVVKLLELKLIIIANKSIKIFAIIHADTHTPRQSTMRPPAIVPRKSPLCCSKSGQ